MPITTVLFDAGGTLVFPNFERVAQELGREGVQADPAVLARAEARVRFGLDRPEIVAATSDVDRWRRYLDNVAAAAGLERMPPVVLERLKAYHDTHNLWEDVPVDVVPALEGLAPHVRMGIVSNANGTVRAKFERLGLARFFEVIVDSHEEGIEKPDPRIFATALRHMDVGTADTVYVGDMYHVDVVGARAAGLRPFLLDPHGFQAHRDVERIRTLTELGTRL
jgi:putative hydrolase of the HAD superfamily